MAFDRQKFLTRTGSALFFVAIMLSCIIYNQWSFFLLFLTIQFIALQEFIFLLERIFRISYKRLTKFIILLAGTCVYTFVALFPLKECATQFSTFDIPQLFYFLGMFLGLSIFILFGTKEKKARLLLSGIGYICIPMALLYHLRLQSLMIPLFLIFSIWINDTMAYVGGSFLGKTPLAKRISPNKTIEGTAIGIIFALLFAFAWSRYFEEYRLVDYLALSFIGSALGTCGDLIESQLKRWAGVKDSGEIMPGHGGALDRFDSLLFSSSFAFLYAFFFMPCAPFSVF